MAEEKIVTINLKKELVKLPKWKRGKLTARILEKKLKKMTKIENLKIDKSINEKIWSGSIEKPHAKFRVRITKVDEKTSKAVLI